MRNVSERSSLKKAEKRIQQLKKEILFHERKYYRDNDPQITDTEFDFLVKELESLEALYPELSTPDSPTQRVGERPLQGFASVHHRIPMLSLDNCYNPEELQEFEDRIRKSIPQAELEYVVELKIDGLGISVIYRNGILEQAITRGDGIRGDEVTANVKTIKSLPLTIPIQDTIEVRGEIFLPFASFQNINKEREDRKVTLFANPRNAAAGSIRLLDPKEVAARRLDAFLYSLFVNGYESESQWQTLISLHKLGFKTNPRSHLCKSLDEVIDIYQSWLTERDNLDYDVDGIVVKVNSTAQQKLLGQTAKFPRWAISLKFPARQATTRIQNILIQVGRTGALTPVAALDPIRLSGITISRSSLHNEDEIRRKDIRIGDLVLIERSGDVIPRVVRVIKDKRTGKERIFVFPSKCPQCDTRVFRPQGEVVARCINPSCPAVIREALLHYASRRAMNIEGLGEALVDQLIQSGLVKEIPDLYHLQLAELAHLERMGQRSSQNLLDQIEKSRHLEPARLIYGLGIRFAGERTSQILTQHYDSLDALAAASLEELMEIPNVGPKVGESLVFFFQQPRNRELIDKIRAAGLNFNVNRTSESELMPLTGQSFVLTGTLPSLTRDQAKLRIEQAGGRVTSSLSTKTDYLVVGAEPGSKLRRAEQIGTPLLTEEELLRLISPK